MRVQNKTYAEDIIRVFIHSSFVTDLGIAFTDCGPGWCGAELQIKARHLQHTGVVHAGVLATLLDNTAGAAAYTLMPQGANPITVEFKVNLLRAATGETLECKATVLKPGERFTVVEAEAFFFKNDVRKLAAKASVTIVST